MSKLVYALSKAGLELAYGVSGSQGNVVATSDPTNSLYKSVVFTTDGYLYTHGKYLQDYSR